MALYAASCSRRFTEDSWANMKRGSDLEDPVRAVAIPRPDARGIVTANMLNKSECGTHGGPAAYHSLSHSLLKWNSADSGVLVSRGGYRAQKLDKHNVVAQDIPGGGEVALRAVVDLAEKRLEYQLVKHTFV